MSCEKLYTERELSKRMQDYLSRNGKRSQLHILEYVFLKHLYMYLTKQQLSAEFKEELYTMYVELINLMSFPNRKGPSRRIQDAIHKHLKIILESEYNGPWTFILLNNTSHYKRMLRALDLLRTWSEHPEFYGYASEKEFWEAMEFMRKEFNDDVIDIHHAVGKYPRKFRKRFARSRSTNENTKSR